MSTFADGLPNGDLTVAASWRISRDKDEIVIQYPPLYE